MHSLARQLSLSYGQIKKQIHAYQNQYLRGLCEHHFPRVIRCYN